jgi:hypothetical protein
MGPLEVHPLAVPGARPLDRASAPCRGLSPSPGKGHPSGHHGETVGPWVEVERRRGGKGSPREALGPWVIAGAEVGEKGPVIRTANQDVAALHVPVNGVSTMDGLEGAGQLSKERQPR